jgi:hypothetical protein
MNYTTANPPWADKLIHDNWNRIAKFAVNNQLPELITFAQLGVRDAAASPAEYKDDEVLWREYGCGNWGCVYPTENPRVVCKLTADPDEIRTVMQISKIQATSDVDGIVRYYGIVRLRGERLAIDSSRPTPVFLIWRESADCGPTLSQIAAKHPGAAELAKAKPGKKLSSAAREALAIDAAWQLLVNSVECATLVYNTMSGAMGPKAEFKRVARLLPIAREWAETDSDYFLMLAGTDFLSSNERLNEANRPRETRGPDASVAYLLAGFELIVRYIGELGVIDSVAEALLKLYNSGVLCADVHQDNICPIRRSGGRLWAITDPGHSVLLGVRPISAPAAMASFVASI